MTLERVHSRNSACVGTESALLPADTRGQAEAGLEAELGQKRVGEQLEALKASCMTLSPACEGRYRL